MAAAWVVQKHFGPDTVFHPAQYGEEPPRTLNPLDVAVIVDFSYPRDVMKKMDKDGIKLVVLDHHKTAQANCEGLPFCKFDMNESGASLAWKHFFPIKQMPRLVLYIKDRDLWKFEMPHSSEINAWIQSFPMDFATYSYLYETLEYTHGVENARNAGEAIERYKRQLVQQICKSAIVESVAGYEVPVVNTNVLMSEVGHELCKQYPKSKFGAYWFKRADGVIQYGARSIGEFDVSEIAKKFGGGGHKNAAGWQMII